MRRMCFFYSKLSQNKSVTRETLRHIKPILFLPHFKNFITFQVRLQFIIDEVAVTPI